MNQSINVSNIQMVTLNPPKQMASPKSEISYEDRELAMLNQDLDFSAFGYSDHSQNQPSAPKSVYIPPKNQSEQAKQLLSQVVSGDDFLYLWNAGLITADDLGRVQSHSRSNDSLMQNIVDLTPYITLAVNSAICGYSYFANPLTNFLINVPLTLAATSALGLASHPFASYFTSLREVDLESTVSKAALATLGLSLYSLSTLSGYGTLIQASAAIYSLVLCASTMLIAQDPEEEAI